MPRDSASLSMNSPLTLTNPESPIGNPKLTAALTLLSPSKCSPACTWIVPPSAASLSTKLITPAMASEPYCDDAPSRSTSTRFIAMPGIMPMSTPCAPLPAAGAKNCTSAERWRRLPLTRTSVWSGAVPRSDVGRTNALPSPVAGVAVYDGTIALMLSVRSAVEPIALNSSAFKTSIGTGESDAVRGLALRVPVVTISSMRSSSPSCATVVCAGTPIAAAATASKLSCCQLFFMLLPPLGTTIVAVTLL